VSEQLNLTKLSLQKTGLIKATKLNKTLEERLHKLGFITGVKIQLIKASPFGSPRIYRLLNTLVAIRDKVAKKVLVEVDDG
jgi:Fe2+ transport system protein FeoA